MVVLSVVKRYGSCKKCIPFPREMNEPLMVIQAKLFTSSYTNGVVHVFTALLQSAVHICELIHIFAHVLTVHSHCYGRCYVKKLKPLCTFFKFYTHLQANSARSFQNVFDKCSRVLNLASSKNWNFSWTSPYFEYIQY